MVFPNYPFKNRDLKLIEKFKLRKLLPMVSWKKRYNTPYYIINYIYVIVNYLHQFLFLRRPT